MPGENSQLCTLRISDRSTARFVVLPVMAETLQGSAKTMALLDSGSDITLIKGGFMERHGLTGKPLKLAISSLGGDKTIESLKVGLKLRSMVGTEAIEINEAFAVDDLPIKPAMSIRDEARKRPHLRGINFRDLNDKEVTILIGSDVPEAHWVIGRRVGGKNPLMLYERSWDGYSVDS